MYKWSCLLISFCLPILISVICNKLVAQHLLYNLDMCSSKFSLLTTSRPNNVTFSEEEPFYISIVSFWGLFFWFFLSIIIAWNFPWLTIMELSLNHYVTIFPSFSNSEIRPFSELEMQEIVIVISKIVQVRVFDIHEKVICDKLKRIRPRIEPCRTPDKSNWKILCVLFIWTLCFHRFR